MTLTDAIRTMAGCDERGCVVTITGTLSGLRVEHEGKARMFDMDRDGVSAIVERWLRACHDSTPVTERNQTVTASKPKKSIAAEWAEFSARLYPPGTSTVQLTECRRAFYAGVTSLYFMLLTQVSPGDEVTEADEDMLKGVNAELEQYANDLEAGRA